MSKNYSANQFESAYKPKFLKNWEVPKVYPLTPRRRSGKTRIIADDKGHLLPEIKQTGNNNNSKFVATWNLPKKIDRRKANELSGIEALKDNFGPKSANSLSKAVPYVPGDFTEEKDRPTSHDRLAENRFKNDFLDDFPKPSYPKYGEDFSRYSPEPQKSLSEQVEDILSASKEKTMVQEPKTHRNNGILSPIVNAISNFNLAKKLHKENLEHEPLPDTITDRIYRKLQMQRIQENDPGLSLEEKNFASAVGWKGYPGYGPTKCTKLKVFRPKTSGNRDSRPGSGDSFEKKWRFIRQNKVTPIDLAICWDLSPEDPSDEPKPPTHVDGSNGSQAPALFALVPTPKDDEAQGPKCNGISIFERGPEISDKNIISDRPKTAFAPVKNKELMRKRAKSALNVNDSDKESERSSNLKPKKDHRSVPNLNQMEIICKRHSCKKLGGRLCVACELKNSANFPGEPGEKPKTEYKMAFKAGVPRKYVSSWIYRKMHVPKQPVPYRPLNYGIHSLVPPFSLQKHKREDYPEHWRLTTVYQHSYKPLHTRKRSLLQTVYK